MTQTILSVISEQFAEAARSVVQASASGYPAAVERGGRAIVEALRAGRKLLVFGNGGSAADAQHICGELVVRFRAKRRALPAISLCTDSAILTACGNDFSFDQIFSRQIEALGVAGDIALAISTSGNSPNVIGGLQTARKLGLRTILLTGPSRSSASEIAEIVIAAPGSGTARIQELHLISYHAICQMVDFEFAEKNV
jgi:D-sedoheptulose 7-phosphate isomerase